MIGKLSKQYIHRLITFGILIVICFIIGLLTDRFFRVINLLNVLKQVSMVIIAASAVNFVLISGGLDLSIGGTMAVSCVTMATVAVAGLPIGVSFVSGMVTGLLIGIINGFLIVVTKISPVIATIGTMYITRGVAFAISGGYTVVNGIPEGFNFIGNTTILGIPLLVIIMISVFIIFYIILNKTLLGKYTYAIGGNRETAALSGINVGRMLFTLYMLSGLMAGLCGSLMASRLGSGDPNIGNGFEFDVVVAIVLGGTSLSGGEGSLIGTVIGALIIGVLTNGMNLLGLGSIYQYIIEGVVLVIAVIIDLMIKGEGLSLNILRKRRRVENECN